MAEELLAPMVGKIKEVHVKVGDKVSEDDTIITFEAMKMESPLGSPKNGIVKEIRVKQGDQAETDDVLAVIE